jgi:hypothetical protein
MAQRNEAGRVRIVTVIEAVAFLLGVGAWFFFERRGMPVTGAIVGTAIWSVITDLEHFVAVNLGFGNDNLFKGYPFDLRKPDDDA